MTNTTGASFILSYTGSTGGIVSGSLLQVPAPGANGTAVTAIPDSGYVFWKRDNNSTANPRTDTNVTANITGIALFT